MSAIDVVGQYGAALAAGDMEALAATFHAVSYTHLTLPTTPYV